MTAAEDSHFFGCDMNIQDSRLRSYSSVFSSQEESALHCCEDTPLQTPSIDNLLDRKVDGASIVGLYPRRHSVSISSSKFFQKQLSGLLRPEPPGLSSNKENRFRERSYSEGGDHLKPLSFAQVNSSRYKTELCRPFEESGSCKYGDKCQFAHGLRDLRSLSRHPKYKTELCRTFHTVGFCPYGPRCHFIHNAEERRGPPPLSAFNKLERPRLKHSCSFAGFPSSTPSYSPASTTTPSIFSSKDLSEWTRSPSTDSTEVFCCLSGRSLHEPPAPPSPDVPHLLRSVSESPRSPSHSLSDQEEYTSSQSGSESPLQDVTRRLPIFSRLSISDD